MATPYLEEGRIIDGFVIGKRVHTGGMALIYRVTHPDHAMPLLMKVPILADGEDPAAIVGFEMEQMILPRLVGPHCPRFVAAGDFAVQPYLVYERIAGDTLKPLMEQLPLEPSAVATLAAKTATALHDLHQQDVIHLDVKPSNIIMREGTGEATLIDFGLSHHMKLPDLMAEEFRVPYGTAPYMAPEQVFGIRSDPRSDLFALGVLMYFFATGTRPFGDPQSLKGLKRRVWWDPTPPRKLNPSIPEWMQEIILRCLSVDPEARHPTAAQLAFDLSNPDQVHLTARAAKLTRDPMSERIKRRFHPEAYRPVPSAKPAASVTSAPIVAVAIDLTESQQDLIETLRITVARVLATVPDARLACLNVLKTSLLTVDSSLDDSGHSVHVQRLVQLKDWARPLAIDATRISYHVLTAVDAGAAILDYANANRVDHIVLGARTKQRFRNLLGSVSSQIVAEAPCTVTVVRPARSFGAAANPAGAIVSTSTAAPARDVSDQ